MISTIASFTPAANALRKPKVGDRVSFRFVLRDVIGTIIEDRGPLGIGGRRLYEITAAQEWADPIVVALSEDEFTLLDK